MVKVGIYIVQILIMLFFFSGCGRKEVSVNKLAHVDLGKYNSYAWLPSGDTSINTHSQDPTVSSGVREKVNSELQIRGYRLDIKDPDFLVLVHSRYDDNVKKKNLPNSYNYYGPGFYTGPWYYGYYPEYKTIPFINGSSVNAVNYTKGTLVIDIIDADTKEVVWRGRATDPIYDQAEIVEEVKENVEEIFEEYPVEVRY